MRQPFTLELPTNLLDSSDFGDSGPPHRASGAASQCAFTLAVRSRYHGTRRRGRARARNMYSIRSLSTRTSRIASPRRGPMRTQALGRVRST